MHRLVRISPYRLRNARRHTSFASVWVYPVVDDKIEIEILDKDLRVDTYRASGAGGQHVNKTDSAVRITHHADRHRRAVPDRPLAAPEPRAWRWTMLKARLYEAELQKREEAAAALEAAKTDIGWGHQIRSYVLQPYQMVKDLRTGVETSNTQACSTATSTASWRPRSPRASRAGARRPRSKGRAAREPPRRARRCCGMNDAPPARRSDRRQPGGIPAALGPFGQRAAIYRGLREEEKQPTLKRCFDASLAHPEMDILRFERELFDSFKRQAPLYIPPGAAAPATTGRAGAR